MSYWDNFVFGKRVEFNRIEGYSESELLKFERLYGIELKGEFFEYMLKMGKCDGGIFGDDSIILYRQSWGVRGHILFQCNFFNQLQELQKFEYLNKPFVFSLESETQYYFLQTANADYDSVYHYDENNEVVKNTQLTFLNYMKKISAYYALYDNISSSVNLIEI